MIATKEHPVAPVVFSDDLGPGARLRQAREAANRSIKDMTGLLHLTLETIEALEADAFDQLPAPMFVRGYLSSYARVLGLPPGPILEVYDRHGFKPPALIPHIGKTSQGHAPDLIIHVVTYAIVAVLVLLVVLWWRNPEFGIGDIGIDLIGPLSDTTPDPQFPTAPTPDGEGAITATAADKAIELSLGAELARGDGAANALTLTEAAVTPATTTIRETPAPDRTGRTESPNEPNDAGFVTAPAPSIQGSAHSEILIEVTQNSWVEVYDRQRLSLFFDLLTPGHVLNLTGAPPFDILLGHPQGARVVLDGAPFDYTPHISRGVARFNLGAAPQRGIGAAAPTGGDSSTSASTTASP